MILPFNVSSVARHSRNWLATLAGLLVACWAGETLAHPHVFIAMRPSLRVSAERALQSLDFTWDYDAAYTAILLRDKPLAAPTGDLDHVIEDLARGQLKSLAAVRFFTRIEQNGLGVDFGEPRLVGAHRRSDGGLSLSFSLPVPSQPRIRAMTIETVDPSLLAYFMVEPAAISSGDAQVGCTAHSTGAKPLDLKNTASVPKAFWAALDGSIADITQFASRIEIACP